MRHQCFSNTHIFHLITPIPPSLPPSPLPPSLPRFGRTWFTQVVDPEAGEGKVAVVFTLSMGGEDGKEGKEGGREGGREGGKESE